MISSACTICIPVFNEVECLGPLGERLKELRQQSPVPIQFLFVDDGSTDGSLEEIRKICRNSPESAFVVLEKNYGLSTAIKVGIDHVATPYLGYMDADLQTSPLDFLELFPFIPEYEMVSGIRQYRRDRFIKRLASIVANHVRRFLIDDGIEDTGCPLKIMDAELAKKMPYFDGMHRFLPALVQLQGGRVHQVPIQHFPRYAGSSKYGLMNRLWKPLFDALVFGWIKQHTIRYRVVERHSIEKPGGRR
jgi:glycosyltransferase involved in cell wall biosynthesis